eukprot:52958-Pyramimonas_sp.AAC.1
MATEAPNTPQETTRGCPERPQKALQSPSGASKRTPLQFPSGARSSPKRLQGASWPWSSQDAPTNK